MLLQIYSIYDKRLTEYMPPICCKDSAEATRTFSNIVNHSDSIMNRFPDDYIAIHIGDFDSECGEIVYIPDGEDIKFSSLVKDETVKYTDLLKKIQSESFKNDSKQQLLDSKINQLDSLISQYELKLQKYKEPIIDDKKSVDTPDFLPTNSFCKKKSILNRLFS